MKLFLWLYCTAFPAAVLGFFRLFSSPAVPVGTVSGDSSRSRGGKANVLKLFSVTLLYRFLSRGFGIFPDGVSRFRQRVKESMRRFPERFFGAHLFTMGNTAERLNAKNGAYAAKTAKVA